MALKRVKITGITGGRARSRFFPEGGQFTSSAGFDPDLSVGQEQQASGLAVPSAYTKFSSTNVNSPVIAYFGVPQKASTTYAVTANGRLISYNSSFGAETLVATVAGGNAGGACYYNNYIYIFGTGASKNDVSRFGPLDQPGAALTDAWWTGLGLTALTNTAYPLIRLASVPNHWGFSHIDNSLYFLDFANGSGLVHRIHTQKGTGGTPYEGYDNSTIIPSAYGVLDLPYGFYPTSVGSYGTNVAISAMQTVSATFNQGQGALFIWNPTNEITFDQQIFLPDPAATALLSRSGHLYVFSGNVNRGCRVSEYVGGSTVQERAYIDDGAPPLAGAVEAVGQRILWGSYCLDPVETACVWAINSRTRTKSDDVQNIACVGTQLAEKSQLCTAISWIGQQNGDESDPQIVVANYDDSNTAIYRKTTGGSNTINSVIRFPLVVIGSNFRIDRIRIPLGDNVQSGTSMELNVLYDDGNSESAVLTISNSVQPNATRVTFKTPQITGQGQNNFILQISMASTNATIPTPIAFPVEVWVEVFDDEPLYG